MALKLLGGCLLAVALTGWLVDAHSDQRNPQNPQPSRAPKYRPPRPPRQAQAPPKNFVPHRPTDTFHSCDVTPLYKVLCGATGISATECEAISCCFDGRTCYYGKSVTLQCTRDGQFIVVVVRDATLPYIDLGTVSILDKGCTPDNKPVSAFAIYQFPVTACGTVMKQEPGVIIYENKTYKSSSFEVRERLQGVKTNYTLLVQCRYTATTVEALVIDENPPLPFAPPEPLNAELRLANGQCNVKGCVEEDVAFSSFYVDSDYPVTKVLRDPVYVEVRMLESTDSHIALTLGRCWLTRDHHPHSRPQWDLLIDGCPHQDDHYQTTLVPVDASSGLTYPTHHRRFVFKMLTFVATGEGDSANGGTAAQNVRPPLKMFIHCGTVVCQRFLGNNCEPRCNRKRRDIAASMKGIFRSEATVVSSKPLVFVDAKTSGQ